jgi:hypothetical protein
VVGVLRLQTLSLSICNISPPFDSPLWDPFSTRITVFNYLTAKH